MTRQEFFCQCFDVIEHWVNGNRKHLREVTDKLYNEVTKPHWISVDDRRPKLKHMYEDTQYSDKVIVTNGEYRTSTCWVHNIWAGWYGWFTDGDEELKDVTHWMPLPQPPKKGD